MSTSDPLSNPFATRYVAPGQVDWIGPSNFLQDLVSRWGVLKHRATVVGVHGAGKSTLLEHFVPRIAEVVYRRDAEGKVVLRNDRQSVQHLPIAVWLQLRKTSSKSMTIPWEELKRGQLLILDGYEQLSLWRRATLILRTQQRGIQLLLTSHRHTILPALCELSISTIIARQIISQLTRHHLATIDDDEVQRRLVAHGGNMREVLMDLYDQFEENRFTVSR